MKKVTVASIVHRGEKRIKIAFETDVVLNKVVRSIQGYRWSKSLSSWHLPDNTRSYQAFVKRLPAGWEIEGPVTEKPAPAATVIERSLLKNAGLAANRNNTPVKRMPPNFPVGKKNMLALAKMIEQLQLKAYSSNTIRTYRTEFFALLQLLQSREVQTLTPNEIGRYILFCINKLHLSENTIHSRLNALKFYFEQVLKREKFFVEIPRPKKRLILPKVLGEQELHRLFGALDNKKHKAILFTAYSAGLRVSETVALKLKDIDADRMQIFVENSKGKKDRYVMLSPVLLDILRNYLRTAVPRPITFLFEGPVAGEALSLRTAQQVFILAKRKGGIRKGVTFHSLRHSFATHLLEKGVDILYIRDLLGHFDIHTTMRYLHVKREMLVNISSPLDALFKNGGKET